MILPNCQRCSSNAAVITIYTPCGDIREFYCRTCDNHFKPAPWTIDVARDIVQFLDACSDQCSPLHFEDKYRPFLEQAHTRYMELRGPVSFSKSSLTSRSEALLSFLQAHHRITP